MKHKMCTPCQERVDKLTDQIAELQEQVKLLSNRLHWIWALGVDYDGMGTVDGLKSLIDELVEITQMSDEEFINTFGRGI